MATTVAALMVRARREIVSHFMSHNAVSPADAVTFEADRRIKRRQFERMEKADVVQATSDGRYWLNLPALDQWQQKRRTRMKLMVGAGIVAAAVAALFAG